MSFFGTDLFVWLFYGGVFGVFFLIIFYFQGIQIREWWRARHRHFTLEVKDIRANQLTDKFKRSDGSEPIEIELEVLHLKRATGILNITKDSKPSRFEWDLEFRGKTLIVSRKDGDLGAGWVVEALESDYHRRYGDRDALYPVAIRNEGRVAHATVVDPQEFFEYLHALKTLSSVEVRHVTSRRGKNLSATMKGASV